MLQWHNNAPLLDILPTGFSASVTSISSFYWQLHIRIPPELDLSSQWAHQPHGIRFHSHGDEPWNLPLTLVFIPFTPSYSLFYQALLKQPGHSFLHPNVLRPEYQGIPKPVHPASSNPPDPKRLVNILWQDFTSTSGPALLHFSSWLWNPADWLKGFPGSSAGKESTCNEGYLDSVSKLGRSPGRGHGNLLHNSCLESPHGQRCLGGYGPWGHKDLDMTEWLSTAQYRLVKTLALQFACWMTTGLYYLMELCYLTSLSLGFLIHNVGIITLIKSKISTNYMNYYVVGLEHVCHIMVILLWPYLYLALMIPYCILFCKAPKMFLTGRPWQADTDL